MMLEICNVSNSLGQRTVLSQVNLTVESGELFALLGPSGCGKTTLLRVIAGLDPIDAGEIWFDGQRVDGLEPRERPFHMVFQNYALFPHLSVADNIAFGLRVKGIPRKEQLSRVDETLALVGLDGLGSRYPKTLSGGQQQRVALARALILQPRVLLLDEPLSALDPLLRHSMRLELAALQKRLGITFILVTHDQQEALMMAQRVACMRGGRIEQCSTPDVLYHRPQSRFVAEFVGALNIMETSIIGQTAGRWILACPHGDAFSWSPERGTDAWASFSEGMEVQFLIRPEYLTLHEVPLKNPWNCLEGHVTAIHFQGHLTHVLFQPLVAGLAQFQVAVLGPVEGVSLHPGKRCFIGWHERSGIVVKKEAAASASHGSFWVKGIHGSFTQ